MRVAGGTALLILSLLLDLIGGRQSVPSLPGEDVILGYQ